MSAANVLALLGGVALFLFGMTLMGDGLKKAAGNRMEMILYRMSNTVFKGILLGTVVTAVIQSSSATSVMAVGFVNSGMMQLSQAISVIYGAQIGTSVTGWIVSLSAVEGNGWTALFSTANLSAFIALVGIYFRMFSKKQTHHHLGDILLGFSVLMYGMQAMSSAVSPLRQSPTFLNLLTTFSNPLIGIGVGIVFTAVLQSASAACGILQALSMTGAVSFAVAYPMLLGISIGAAVPVLLSALGAKTDGKRTAFSYLVIAILGSLVCGILYYALNGFMHFSFADRIMDPFSIALVNTLFRIVTVIFVAPFTTGVNKIVSLLIPQKDSELRSRGELDRLDERFLATPALAVEQTRLTILAMAETAKENILLALKTVRNFDVESCEQIEAAEDLLDSYEDKLGTYLMKISAHELSRRENEQSSKFLHTISDFERIGDHAMNLAENSREIHEKKVVFSGPANHELDVLFAAVEEILDLAIQAFEEDDKELAYRVEPLEEHIDNLCALMKRGHVERLQRGDCSLNQGFVFNDILGNVERIADHCSNLAVAVIELGSDVLDTHEYMIELKAAKSNHFTEYYEEYMQKYSV